MDQDFAADILGVLGRGLSFSTYDVAILSLSAVGVLFVALFVVPLGLQRLAGYRETARRLGRLRRDRADDHKVSMSAVMACFAGAGHMSNEASSYLRTVQRLSGRADDGLPGFGTSEAAQRYFSSDKLGRSVLRDMAYALGLLLTGLAVISLVLTALGGTGLAPTGTDLAALATKPHTVAVPAVAALLLFVAAESIYLAQRREVNRMCWILDELFLVPASLLTAEHLVASLHASADRQREALTSLAEDIRDALTNGHSQLGEALRGHDERFFETMSARLGQALEGPTQALSAAAQAGAADQGNRVKALLEALLQGYIAELTAVERTQLEGLRDILAETLSASRELREAFETGIGRVADDAGANAAALTARLENLISDDFGESVQAVRAAAADLRQAAADLTETVQTLHAGLIDLPATPDRTTSNEIADILGEFQDEADKLSRAHGRR